MYAIYDQGDFGEEFQEDVSHEAQAFVMILIPYLSPEGIERMIPAFQAALKRNVRICVFGKMPMGWENRHSLRGAEAEKFKRLELQINTLRNIGVHFTLRKYVHMKIAVIDGRILWHGSLNILSFNPNMSTEEMHRTENVFEAMAAIGRQKLDRCSECIALKKNKSPDANIIDGGKALGKIIESRRMSLGMTLDDLADKSGLARKTIWRIENGDEHDPRLSTLIPLLKALDSRMSVLPDFAVPFVKQFLETAPDEQSLESAIRASG